MDSSIAVEMSLIVQGGRLAAAEIIYYESESTGLPDPAGFTFE